jgi:hypothetical protein
MKQCCVSPAEVSVSWVEEYKHGCLLECCSCSLVDIDQATEHNIIENSHLYASSVCTFPFFKISPFTLCVHVCARASSVPHVSPIHLGYHVYGLQREDLYECAHR